VPVKNTKSVHGFTLVELLVVISVIALLLAILMPALQKARRQGQKIVCLSNLHQTYFAFSMYAMDNKDFLPGNWEQTDWKGLVSKNRYYVRYGIYNNHGLLFSYLGKRPHVLWCAAGPTWAYDMWRLYAKDDRYDLYSHYSLRSLITAADAADSQVKTPADVKDKSFMKMSSRRKAAKSGLLADTSTQLNYWMMPGVQEKCRQDRYKRPDTAFAAWHWDVYDTLYYDGHAKSLRYNAKMFNSNASGLIKSAYWQADNTYFWDYADNQ